MRPSDATPVNVSKERHRRVGDDTTLVESVLRVRDRGRRGEWVVPAESGSLRRAARHRLHH
jgi:hypothetical protein